MKKPIIIVAIDENNGIGLGTTLPWHIQEDLQHFKETTAGQIVVMGRRTYRSIGKPLPNRRNIILTRTGDKEKKGAFRGGPGTELYSSLEEGLAATADDVRDTFIIGGASVYKEALEKKVSDVMIVTHIPQAFECDTWFPQINLIEWRITGTRRVYSAKYEFFFNITTYRRR